MKFPLMLFIKVKVLIVASSFFRIALGLQVPILYVFVLQLGGDLRHLGTIFAIYGVTYAVMTFLITLYWLEYRHYLLSMSFLMWALYALLMYIVETPEEIYVLQFFAGGATAIGRPGFTQILILNTFKHEYTKVYGFYSLLGSILGALSALASGFIGHYYAIRPLFLGMFVFALFSFIVSLYVSQIKDRES